MLTLHENLISAHAQIDQNYFKNLENVKLITLFGRSGNGNNDNNNSTSSNNNKELVSFMRDNYVVKKHDY